MNSTPSALQLPELDAEPEAPLAAAGPSRIDVLASALDALAAGPARVQVGGTVSEVMPGVCRVTGLSRFVRLGECVELQSGSSRQLGEVIRIDGSTVTVKPFDTLENVGLGGAVWQRGPIQLAPHDGWKGRIIDALARPIDGGGPMPQGERLVSTDREPPSPMRRQRVTTPLRTGLRVIDLFTPLCAGQRIGIFAGSGVGKSTTLAMLARATGFDCVVVALVGERGREVREFLEDVLASERQRSIAVVSTGDDSPMMRRLAPKTAMAIAEYFRDRGESVLLIVDSVTRFAHAAREVALAAGEPPVARGYAPSVFSELPRLLERAGPGEEGGGSITGIFSVLVDGDDHNDPVADSIRGTLDGHVVLDRGIADQGRYPAVNMLTSVSRLAHHVWTGEQQKLVLRLKSLVARFEDTRDLRLMGGYRAGSDADLDKAIELVPRIYDAMRQSPGDGPSVDAFQEVARALAPPPQPQAQG